MKKITQKVEYTLFTLILIFVLSTKADASKQYNYNGKNNVITAITEKGSASDDFCIVGKKRIKILGITIGTVTMTCCAKTEKLAQNCIDIFFERKKVEE